MRTGLISLACLSAFAAGCDQANEAASRQFDEQFRANCISAATGGQLAPDLVAKACDCSLAKINEQYGPADKLTLTNEQAQPIAAQCLAEVQRTNG